MSKTNGRRSIAVTAVITAISIFITFIYHGLRWNPRFDISLLTGLSPDQVVRLLGKPRRDLRDVGWTLADEANGEPLRIFYGDEGGWLGQEYEIDFLNNKVVAVKKSTK